MAKTAYQRTALTGGGASALDGIDGAGLLDGDFAVVMASGKLYFYILDADSAAAESSPDVISPDDNAGNKRWVIERTPGSVVQVVNTETGAVATGTTQLPADDSIPQSTEGDQYMSLAITPKNTNNNLIIIVTVVAASSYNGSNWMGVALFQDTTANALAAVFGSSVAQNSAINLTLTHYMAAGTVSATTFKVRIGGSAAGTTTFNGTNAGRIFGGVMASSITIWEVAA